MILSILIFVKTIIFVSITKVTYNLVYTVLITSLTSILLLSLVDIIKRKHKRVIIIALYTLISFLMLGDSLYFSQFGELMPISMLSVSGQLTTVGDSILVLLNIWVLAFIIDLPAILFIKNLKLPKPSYVLAPLLSIILLATMSNQINSISSQELYNYHIKDIAINILSKSHVPMPTITELKDLKKRTTLTPGKLTGLGKGKNLIVIQVEGLQQFVIEKLYDGQEITPNVNKLVKDSGTVYFQEYYQLVGHGNTSDAEFVSQNSLYPSTGKPSNIKYEKNTLYGLPWLLRDNGYTAWAFHGYKKEFWNRDNAFTKAGFERFVNEEDFDFKDTLGLGITDKDFFNQSIDYIKELDSIDDNPFYAFLITLSSHTPFNIPNELHEIEIMPQHKDTILSNYLQAIHYTDKQIGMFIERLKENGLYENTVIAIYGDHFGISSLNDKYAQMMTDWLGSYYGVDNMMNIPLIIHIPGEEIKETITTVGSHLDFYPTILNVMGYKNEKGLMMGKDIANNEGDNFVAPQSYINKGSFIYKDVLYVMGRDNIFEHGQMFRKGTKTQLNLEEYRNFYEKILQEIELSKKILENDIFK